MIPKVSVIMSEYNTEPSILNSSIKSILNQTYTNFEFIIVNDGESNRLQKIVSNIGDDRIKVINNPTNLGLPTSLNKAIDLAKGEYLVRMDTDDVAHPKRIEVLVDFMEVHKEYAVVGSSVNILTETGKKIPKIKGGEIDKNSLMNRRAPVHPSVIMRKKDIIEIGKYKTENVNRCEDFVLWATLLLNDKRIYILNEILLDYRVEMDNYVKRNISTRKDEIKNRIKYYKLMGANFNQYMSISKSIIAGMLPSKVIANYHRKKL